MRYGDLGPVGRQRLKVNNRQAVTKKKPWRFFFLAGLAIGALFLVVVKSRGLKWPSPLSVFSQIMGGGSLKQTDGRTNILILGIDSRFGTSTPSATLSDTMLLGSFATSQKTADIISLPRDLWVRLDTNYSGKINAAYAVRGIEATKQIVADVTGLPVHYYIVLGFEGFKEAINVLGGVEVEVEKSFDDYRYPIAGRENWECPEKVEAQTEAQSPEVNDADPPEEVFHPCRYEHIHFEAGRQKMDGETALQYARSRHALGSEGSDFARAKRQQRLIMAVKEKAMSAGTILNPARLNELYEAYQKYVETDINLAAAQKLVALGQQIGGGNIATYVLGDGEDIFGQTLLLAPAERTLYGGQYVLIPRAADFSAVRAWVQRNLFGEK
ncbi:MAG: LCP family protein [bacterium]|nr:LCP family protein [bacterium]